MPSGARKWWTRTVSQLVNKLWGGQEYLEDGDGEKKRPRDPITAAQIKYIFVELEHVASQRDPKTGIFVRSFGLQASM